MTGKGLERHRDKSAKAAERYAKLMISVERSNAARIRKSKERAEAKALALSEAAPILPYGSKRAKNPDRPKFKKKKGFKAENAKSKTVAAAVFLPVPPRERQRWESEEKPLRFPVVPIQPYQRSAHKAPIGFTGEVEVSYPQTYEWTEEDHEGNLSSHIEFFTVPAVVHNTARIPANAKHSYIQGQYIRHYSYDTIQVN